MCNNYIKGYVIVICITYSTTRQIIEVHVVLAACHIITKVYFLL